MNEQLQAAAGDDFWRGLLAIVVLACLALAVWRVAQTRPATPGLKGAPAHAPSRPAPASRASEDSEPFLAA
jgi:hypothetical protein